MIDFIQGECIPKSKFPNCTLDQFVVQEGIHYFTRVNPEGSVNFVPVVPQCLKPSGLNFAHITLSGYLGQYKTMLKVEQYSYWTNLKVEVVCRFGQKLYQMSTTLRNQRIATEMVGISTSS